jgi:hypothetical protein
VQGPSGTPVARRPLHNLANAHVDARPGPARAGTGAPQALRTTAPGGRPSQVLTAVGWPLQAWPTPCRQRPRRATPQPVHAVDVVVVVVQVANRCHHRLGPSRMNPPAKITQLAKVGARWNLGECPGAAAVRPGRGVWRVSRPVPRGSADREDAACSGMDQPDPIEDRILGNQNPTASVELSQLT